VPELSASPPSLPCLLPPCPLLTVLILGEEKVCTLRLVAVAVHCLPPPAALRCAALPTCRFVGSAFFISSLLPSPFAARMGIWISLCEKGVPRLTVGSYTTDSRRYHHARRYPPCRRRPPSSHWRCPLADAVVLLRTIVRAKQT
jgi:hypothetical protein